MPPFAYKPPYIFHQSSCTGMFISHRYFCLANRLPQPWPCKIATWSFVKTLTQSSSRSPWWSGNARTKPASTDQLRNLLTIASMFANGVDTKAHWKDKSAECLEMPPSLLWPTSVSRFWRSSFWRTREAKADQCRTSFYRSVIYVPMLTTWRSPRRGGVFVR